MGGRVHQQVVDEHYDIGDAVDNGFNEALETGQATQWAHGAGNLLKLAYARDCEGSGWPGPQVQDHLPEACSEVNDTEDSTT